MRIRFGFQLTGEHLADPAAVGRRAEELGFDTVLVADHVGTGPSPMVTLATVAAATSTIRLGTLVLNNDMRNPVQLAWEAASLDRLSHGRFELGLGAGHTPQEFAASGIGFEAAAVRKRRLAESVEIIRALVDGETVDFDGEHYQLHGARIDRARQDRLPILIGGNGESLLRHAGEWADIVGLQGLGRTLADGHSHTVRWDPDWVTIQVGQVHAGAGDRFVDIELNALVQVVDITDDRDAALGAICDEVDGLEPRHSAEIPYLLVGTVDEVADHIERCHDRWGIGYFVVRELDAFAPIIELLR